MIVLKREFTFATLGGFRDSAEYSSPISTKSYKRDTIVQYKDSSWKQNGEIAGGSAGEIKNNET